MNELYFIAMDIEAETIHLVNSKTFTDGMTESEFKAYCMGIQNTISALRTVMETENENELILNVKDIEVPTEFFFDELETYLKE